MAQFHFHAVTFHWVHTEHYSWASTSPLARVSFPLRWTRRTCSECWFQSAFRVTAGGTFTWKRHICCHFAAVCLCLFHRVSGTRLRCERARETRRVAAISRVGCQRCEICTRLHDTKRRLRRLSCLEAPSRDRERKYHLRTRSRGPCKVIGPR